MKNQGIAIIDAPYIDVSVLYCKTGSHEMNEENNICYSYFFNSHLCSLCKHNMDGIQILYLNINKQTWNIAVNMLLWTY